MGYFRIERAVLGDGALLLQRQTASQLYWIKHVIDEVWEEVLSWERIQQERRHRQRQKGEAVRRAKQVARSKRQG